MKSTLLTAMSLILLSAGPVQAQNSANEKAKEGPACEGGKCVISTVNPHAAPQPHAPKADAPEVLKTLEQIVKAYSSGDLPTYETLLDKDCTYFDQEHGKMIVGKPAVTEHLKASFAKHAPNGSEPLASYTIDQPYVKVSGNMAVVTYHAKEEIGGSNPMHGEGLITKVFVRAGDGWHQQHDNSFWKKTAKQ